jgi:hypothetical protein
MNLMVKCDRLGAPGDIWGKVSGDLRGRQPKNGGGRGDGGPCGDPVSEQDAGDEDGGKQAEGGCGPPLRESQRSPRKTAEEAPRTRSGIPS